MDKLYSYVVKSEQKIIGCDSILCGHVNKVFEQANKFLFYVYEDAVQVEIFEYESGSFIHVKTINVY